MAAVSAVSDASPMPENEWNEASIESALARLQEMHVQLRHLRDAVPRLIDPMLVSQPSPEGLYNTFATNVTTISSDVKYFSKIHQDNGFQEILKKSEKSRAASDEDIPGWRVMEHEDWLDARNVDTIIDVAIDGTNEADPGVNQEASTELEFLRAAIERLKQGNPSIEVFLDESSRTMKVSLSPQAHPQFEVECKSSPGRESAYTVTTTEKTKLHDAMITAINSRSQPNNLASLLEMLASYKDVRSQACSNCCRLLDVNAQFPVVRSKKKLKQSDGTYKIMWQALHTACRGRVKP